MKKEELIPMIKRLREKGKTYQQIADLLGISRQRVHQIYRDGERKEYKRVARVPLKCKYCKKKFAVPPYLANKKFCKNDCRLAYVKEHAMSPEERKRMLKIWHRNAYLRRKKQPPK